jgi:hypothetical protein
MNVNVEKTVAIRFEEVVDAYAIARQGGKAAGIDHEHWEDFERELTKNLYVVWNRVSIRPTTPPRHLPPYTRASTGTGLSSCSRVSG